MTPVAPLRSGTNDGERLILIDTLRGISALSVVLYHYCGLFEVLKISHGRESAAVLDIVKFGHLGVPIFFVLSGFVIALTADRIMMSGNGAARFVARRLVRLVPPYWFMLGLFFLAFMFGSSIGLYRNTSLTIPQLLIHAVYLQKILQVPSIDIIYWTLCLEVQFYLVFSFLGWAFTDRRALIVLLLLTCLASYSVRDLVSYDWFPSLWYQFAVGSLAFHAARGQLPRLIFAMLMAGLAGFSLWNANIDSCVAIGTATILAATGGRLRWLPFRRGFLFMGMISYSLYLCHGFVGQPIGLALRKPALATELYAWVLIVVTVFGAIAFSFLLYSFIEKPAIVWSHRINLRKKVAVDLERKA